MTEHLIDTSKKAKTRLQIAPSILSGDFGNLEAEARKLALAGADAIHIDIMDGLFVGDLTLGPKAVAAIRKAVPNLFLDVHLMIYEPLMHIERFVKMGANRITIHLEAIERDLTFTLETIKKCGIEAGIALSPETSVELMEKWIDKCDLLLVMTVEPGASGQAFIPEMVEKIAALRAMCDKIYKGEKKKMAPRIQVDGGINKETAQICIEAGADAIVSGTYLFSAKDMKEAINSLRALCS